MAVMKFEEKVKILDWMESHREEATGLTPSELIPRIQADVAIVKITTDAVKAAAKVRGVELRNRRKPQVFHPTQHHDVAAVLAKSIRQLANEFGVKLEYADELNMVVQRLNLSKGES